MTGNKHMLSTEELIEKLKDKNIKFKHINEKNTIKYLEETNNCYNITAYKNNFEQFYINNEFIDKYTDLDFAYLCDLARIDYELRILLFELISNIEHHLKLRILKIVKEKDDGYNIVNLYLDKDYNNKNYPKKLHKSIYTKTGSVYYKKIFNKYDINQDKKLENIPIWEFLEIITFGELIDFYNFITLEYNLKSENKNVFILRDVGRLRNAIYHNTNVLTDLKIKDNEYHVPYEISQFLTKNDISKKIIIKKIKNSRIKQITSAIYMFKFFVNDKNIQRKTNKKVKKFIYKRIIIHKSYYNNNELLKSVYEYFSKIVEKHFK